MSKSKCNSRMHFVQKYFIASTLSFTELGTFGMIKFTEVCLLEGFVSKETGPCIRNDTQNSRSEAPIERFRALQSVDLHENFKQVVVSEMQTTSESV